MADSSESPYSVTYSLKDGSGLPLLFTIRGNTFKEIVANMVEAKTIFLSEGYTGQEKKSFSGSTFSKPAPEVVPNRPCPTCGQPLVYGTTKDGKKFIKCSTQKWDFMTKKATGCPFIEWNDAKVSTPMPTIIQDNEGTQGAGELATFPQKNLILSKFPELWVDGMTKSQATEIIRVNLSK